MLIICNGTFKSGSTWIHAIVLELLRANKIKLMDAPIDYTNNINSPTTIIESKLFKFLDNEDYINNNYITKSHYILKKTIFRDYDLDTYFLFVERDVRDAIVSHYYHLKKKYNFIGNFRLYYLFIGRFKAFEILKFNRMYLDSFGEDNFFKYSDMKNNFEIVLLRISSILNLKELSSNEIMSIKRNTSIAKMRNDLLLGKTKYYSTVSNDREGVIRKGIIGDWVDHFSKSQQIDIEMLESLESSFVFKFTYSLLFTFRRWLFKIE
jgi:hypothetical protein